MSLFRFFRLLISLHVIFEVLRDAVRSRAALHMEVLALRHHLTVLQRLVKRPKLKLTSSDRLQMGDTVGMVAGLAIGLVIVRPETVIAWHRKAYRLFWTWKSRRGRAGRPAVSAETRQLIRTMSRDNPALGRTADPWRMVQKLDLAENTRYCQARFRRCYAPVRAT